MKASEEQIDAEYKVYWHRKQQQTISDLRKLAESATGSRRAALLAMADLWLHYDQVSRVENPCVKSDQQGYYDNDPTRQALWDGECITVLVRGGEGHRDRRDHARSVIEHHCSVHDVAYNGTGFYCFWVRAKETVR